MDLDPNLEISETGKTLEENSHLKANFLHSEFGLNSFADDTGLEVEALDGAPGVYSARYAGSPADSQRNVDKLLYELQMVTNREARFRTVITLILEGVVKQFVGTINGTIAEKARGNFGFGYDPVFVPDGHVNTFAEMSIEEKNQISHRRKAIMQLVEYLKSREV